MKKPNYFSPISDVGFHKLFCTEGNDTLVLQLLNAVIDDKTIVKFERLDTYHQINIQANSVFDLYCTCNDDSRIIVECQKAGTSADFMNRALAYSAMAILDQAREKWDYDFDKVYFIGILDYIHFHGREQAFTKVALCTLDDHTVTNANYLQIFVEMPKLAADKGRKDFGALFLKAMRSIAVTDSRTEDYAHKDLDLLFKTASYNNLSDDEQVKYEKEMTTKLEYEAYARECAERARAEGEAKGRSEGEANTRREVAKKMLADGLDAETIAKYTGFSKSEIELLKN